MDSWSKYFHDLNKLISHLDSNVRVEIMNDLLKLEFWVLPELSEIDSYIEKLGNLSTREWKFMLKEFKSDFHTIQRNENLIRIIEIMRIHNIKIKPVTLFYYLDINMRLIEMSVDDAKIIRTQFHRHWKSRAYAYFKEEFRSILK